MISKPCNKCGINKPLTDYHRDRLLKDGRRHICKCCTKKYSTKYRSTKPDTFDRDSHYKKTYNITIEDYDIMFEEQEGKCKICGTTESGSKYKHFSVDHCHVTSKVRGLLCHQCNVGLGYFKDNIYSLEQAIKYLEGGI